MGLERSDRERIFGSAGVLYLSQINIPRPIGPTSEIGQFEFSFAGSQIGNQTGHGQFCAHIDF